MTNDQKKLFGIDKLNIKRSSIPAVTHVDYSARVQTVHKETNEKYYKFSATGDTHKKLYGHTSNEIDHSIYIFGGKTS